METTIPQNPTQQAAALGYPATVQGFTPNERGYWFEPGLPWMPADGQANMFTPDRRGMSIIWHFTEFGDNSMAPRFPAGTVVNIVPVWFRTELELGKVYGCRHKDPATGKERWQAGRLAVIGGNYLELTRDNAPVGLIVRLRDDAAAETWDVYELTHHAHYPAL